MGNVSREMEILRKNQEEMLEIKNIVTKMKNTFDGFISRLTTDEERISKLEDLSIESSKIKWKENKDSNRTEYPRIVGQLQKREHTHSGAIRRRRKRERDREDIWVYND